MMLTAPRKLARALALPQCLKQENLCGTVAMLIVEHHAESVLSIVDRAYVLVNGQIAFEGDAVSLERDPDLQARLLGVVQNDQLEAILDRAAS